MLEVLASRTPDVRLSACGPVLVSCFLNWPTAKSLAAMRDAQLALKQRHPRQFSLAIIPALNGLPPGAAAPSMQQSSDERDAAAKDAASIGKELEDLTVASAMVILSRGLLAVMIRTFIAAMSLVSTSRIEMKVFRSLPEAEAWFRSLPNAPAVPEGLSADVETWLDQR